MIRRLGLAAIAAALALAVLAVPAGASTLSFMDITARDGTVLKANVYRPAQTGPRPAIVFINSWGLNNLEYLAQAEQFADDGYVVLSYTTRGFYNSGGKIECAGPKDVADFQDAVSWLLANTPADPARVGAGGISYGSGISLLGAAADPRVKAVAAMSTWADLFEALFGNQTRHLQAAGLLKLAADITGRPSDELNTVLDDFFGNRNIAGLSAFAAPRSAKNVVGDLNANGTAILMANAYGDSLFTANPLAQFFGQLTGPKRLELRPGDHAIPELTGILGLPNAAWTSTHRWFDQHLRGVNTGIASEPPVQLQIRGTSTTEGFASWSAVSSGTQRFGLTDIGWLSREGNLSSSLSSGWSDSVWAGDTTANGGVVLLTNGAEALTGEAPWNWIPSVDRDNAGVWQSGYFSSARKIRGAPKLKITLTPSNSGQSTAVAYLYDTDVLGNGSLIGHVPVTLRGISGGQARTVDLEFPVTSYDVPSGHRLSLVIDTADPLYADKAPWLTTMKFSSPSANPSSLTIPLK